MKKSIRRQMTIIFIALVSTILLLTIVINSCFLETFYIHDKQSSLIRVYKQINEAAERGKLTASETIEHLEEEIETQNIAFVVMTGDGQEIMSTAQNQKRAQELLGQLMGYIFNKNQDKSTLLKDGGNYEIRSMKEVIGGGEYIEMWGYLQNGNAFILRSPMESIRDSAMLSNEFFIYITLIMIVLGSLFVWYFTRRITNPLLELTRLSERMADLDFEVKYESGGHNEVGVLGANFNVMSEKLEHAISELKNANHELQKDIERKEKIDSMRTEFIGNVSHELKTPIALIQGYAEGLKEGVSTDAESREYYCDVILDEANKMNQLVQSLLTLNQLEFGEADTAFERFDVMEVIAGVLQSNDILIQQKEARVQVNATEDKIYVWADAYKTEQVVRNYLSNALNHIEGEHVIDIRVSINSDTEKVRISVFNTGEQIPEEDLEHIWDKFYKVDKARTREYGGHGIGLSIVKAIMESFQQKYGVVNYENGVAFWFELDLK